MSDVSGVISGKVADESKQGLPGVIITVSGPGFDQVEVSNARGEFMFRSVPPGSYSALAQLEGFASQTIKPVDVRIDHTTVVDFMLRQGQ